MYSMLINGDASFGGHPTYIEAPCKAKINKNFQKPTISDELNHTSLQLF